MRNWFISQSVEAIDLRGRIIDLQTAWINIYNQDDDLLLGNC
jgi:hypothetical protein